MSIPQSSDKRFSVFGALPTQTINLSKISSEEDPSSSYLTFTLVLLATALVTLHPSFILRPCFVNSL